LEVAKKMMSLMDQEPAPAYTPEDVARLVAAAKVAIQEWRYWAGEELEGTKKYEVENARILKAEEALAPFKVKA
jgi:hypothetical protein